ncbi:hypothetical protein FRC01_008373, partial [Tulasnella sp. 417]
MFAIIDGKDPNEATISLPSEQLKDLLAKCWSREPNERPEVVDCLSMIESILPIDGSDFAVSSEADEKPSASPSTAQAPNPLNVEHNPDRSSDGEAAPTQHETPRTTTQPLPKHIPAQDLAQLPLSLPPIRRELTVTRRMMRNLRLNVFNPDRSSDDEAAPIQRDTPQMTAQPLPKHVPAPDPAKVPPSPPSLQGELTVTGHMMRNLGLSVFGRDKRSDDDSAPIQRDTPRTTAQPLPKNVPAPDLAQPPPSLPLMQSELNLRGRIMRRLGLSVFKQDRSSDDASAPIQRDTPRTTTQPLPTQVPAPDLEQLPSYLPSMQSESTATGVIMKYLGPRVLNPDSSSDDDSDPVQRNTSQTTAQPLPKHVAAPGAAQIPPSLPWMQSESTVTGRGLRSLGLRVFNPDDSSDDDAIPTRRNTPHTTAQLLPKPLPVPGVAQGSYFPQQPPLQQL